MRIFFVLLLLWGAQAAAQTQPPVYEIKTDTPVARLQEQYWQMLTDTAGKWTLDEVLSPPLADRFHANNLGHTPIGFRPLTCFWQRFRVKNASGKPLQLIFQNRPAVDRYDLYFLYPGGLQLHGVNGRDVPFSKRTGFQAGESVPLQLKNGEEVTVYKRLYVNGPRARLELLAGFSFADSFLKDVYQEHARRFQADIRNGFIAGLLIFGFIINLFFFRIVRERLYLYYSLFLLAEGLWYLAPVLLFREHPEWNNLLDALVFYSTCFFFVTMFVREFLKTARYHPRFDRFLMFLIVSVVILSVTNLFLFRVMDTSWRGIPNLVQNGLFTLLMFSLLAGFLFIKKEKDPFTRLSVLAAVPAFVVWSVLYGLRSVYGFLNLRYNVQAPESFVWVFRNTDLIEMYCVGWFAILFSWILLQRYALLRKELTLHALERERERNELMNQQKAELEKQVDARTAELRQSIEELKATQKQLIQSEKMASLGELTAGIAHEIQNPLNFINNFSELSAELAEDMEKELSEGRTKEAIRIGGDIRQNLQKVVFHGRRADSIVKGMLQHSRASSGKKEPADLNALADEYLRLSYHGLRAKDKSFNALTETRFDPDLGPVPLVAQDMGRVLLNLFSNAFYSVSQRKKKLDGDYVPKVMVSTKRIKLPEGTTGVEIRVRDNGLGIPHKVLDKVYQPFFTTKPAGEGTGLGLSLSYEIVTKVHGGTLELETVEGEFAEFIIRLPVNQAS